MRLTANHMRRCWPASRGRAAAFTLTELMVSMTIFTLVIGGMISGHVFGLKVFQLTRSNLGAADSGRILSTRMGSDIRSAMAVKIGKGDRKSFTELSTQEIQQGNAIQIYSSTDTNDYVRYFVDATEGKLVLAAAAGSSARVIADGIINQDVFRAEDATGQILTNRQNGYVLGINLQYGKVPGSDAKVGRGQYYDSFQWQMKVAVRARQ